MKKLLVISAIFMLSLSANAEVISDKIYTSAQQDLSNNLKPGEDIELTVINPGHLTKDLNLEHGETISVKILNYNKPKRGKRDGYYDIQYNDKTNGLMKGKMLVGKQKDIKEISKKASTAVASHLLKATLLPQALAVTKGLIKPNENQNRLQSAGTNLYESTPLTYVEEGQEFNVAQDGLVVIKVKTQGISEEE